MKNLLWFVVSLLLIGIVFSCTTDDLNVNQVESVKTEDVLWTEVDYLSNILSRELKKSRVVSDNDITSAEEHIAGREMVRSTERKDKRLYVTMKNGFTVIMDFVNYEEHGSKMVSHKATPKNSKVQSRQTSENTSVDSLIVSGGNDVLVWSPFDDCWTIKLTDSISDVLRDYVGMENVSTILNYDCKYTTINNFRNYGIVIIDSHGADGRFLFTRDTLNFREQFSTSDSIYLNNVGLYLRPVNNVVGKFIVISYKFIKNTFSAYGINKRNLIINASCESSKKDSILNAFKSKGLDGYIGCKGIIGVDICASGVRKILLSLLRDRKSIKESMVLLNDTVEFDYWHTDEVSDIYYAENLKYDSLLVVDILNYYQLSYNTELPFNKWDCVLCYDRIMNLLLSGKKLSGPINEKIYKLSTLIYLDLSQNLLCDTISSEIRNLKKLRGLNLSSNNLYGVLPQEMDSLYYNEYCTINLKNNNFEGLIPFGLYSDNNSLFDIDTRYIYNQNPDSSFYAVDNKTGLYFIDEPYYELKP